MISCIDFAPRRARNIFELDAGVTFETQLQIKNKQNNYPSIDPKYSRAQRGAKSMKLIIPAKHPNNKLWKFDVALGCEAGTGILALTACHIAKVPPQLFGPETQI